MRELTIAIISGIKKISISIGEFFKLIFMNMYTLIKSISLLVAKGIKKIAVFLWNYILSYIFKFIFKIIRLIYLFFSKILIYLHKIIKTCVVLIYKYILRYIGLGIFYTFKMIYNFLRFIITNIWKGIKFICIFIYTYIVRTITRFIYRFAIKPIIKLGQITLSGFKSVIQYIYNALISISKWIYRNILIYIGRVFQKIYNGVRWLLIKIGQGIEILSSWIYKFILRKIFRAIYKIVKFIFTGIWRLVVLIGKGLRLVVHICLDYIWVPFTKFIRFIIIGLKNLIILIFKRIYLLYLSMPNMIHTFINLLVIYFILILHFIFVMTLKVVFYTIPVFIMNQLIKVFNFIFKVIGEVFSSIGRILTITIRYIGHLIENIWLYVTDYATYYYIILLSPIILSILFVMLIASFIYLLPQYIFIFIISLFGKKILSINEIIYIKDPYHPIKYLYKNLNSLLLNLKYKYVFSYKLKGTWILIQIITWQLIFKTIFFVISIIIYFPFELLSYIIFKDKNIVDRIVIKDNYSIGLIMLKPSTLFGKRLTYHIDGAIIDEETKQFIVPNALEGSFKVEVIYDGNIVKTQRIKLKSNDSFIYLSEFNKLKQEILENKTFTIKLPQGNSELFNIKYETIWQRDIIDSNRLIVRSIARHTDLKVILESKTNKGYFEQNINLNHLINPTKLRRISKKVIRLKYKESIYKYLPKGYSYTFEDTPYLDRNGVIQTKDDISFDLNFNILGFEEYFKIVVLVKPSKDTLKEYIKQLSSNLIDEDNLEVNLNSITRSNNTIKNVTWEMNQEQLRTMTNQKLLYQQIKQNKKTVLRATFDFNRKRVVKKIIIRNRVNIDELYNDYLVDALKPYFEVIDKENSIFEINKISKILDFKTIKLPRFIFSKIICIRYETLSPNTIKNSGLIIGSNYKESKMRLVLYINIFKRKQIDVTFLKPRK